MLFKKQKRQKKYRKKNILLLKRPRNKGSSRSHPNPSIPTAQEYRMVQDLSTPYLDTPFTDPTYQILQTIRDLKYKAIIIYPETITAENESTMTLLKHLADEGFLCCYCTPSQQNEIFNIKAAHPNVIVLNKQQYLLPIVRNISVIVICSDLRQLAWAEMLHDCYIIYDIKADFNHSHDLAAHKKLTNRSNCNLISDHNYNSYIGPDNYKAVIRYQSEDVQPLLKHIYADSSSWPAFANVDMTNKVAVMTATFLDYNGRNFFSGGAERYIMDLAEQCEALDSELTIWQFGNSKWMRRHGKIDVVSLASNRSDIPFLETMETVKNFNVTFYEKMNARTKLNIYSAFLQAWPLAAKPNIGISHGIAWDHELCKFEQLHHYFENNMRIIQGAKACDSIVSVDTSTSNWFQTMDYECGQNMKFIPNYADLNLFYPASNRDRPLKKKVILYPRRLYKPRGFYMLLEIMDDILNQYPFVEFWFVGKGYEVDTKHLDKKKQLYPDRIRHFHASPEQMPEVYRSADITLIPTLFSEGTSLSCIEAMASGNAVIATRIGGLPDLIINEYNGLLIEPNRKALKEAIIELLSDANKFSFLQRNAVEVAKTFSKYHWEREWRKLIHDKSSTKTTSIIKRSRLIEIYLSALPVNDVSLSFFIIHLLVQGDLVYIRLKNAEPVRHLSSERIQWLDWDEITEAEPDEIYADEQSASAAAITPMVILNKKWLKKFISSAHSFQLEP